MNCWNMIQDIRLNLLGTVRSNPAGDDQGRGLQLQKHCLRERSTSDDLGEKAKIT